jgi:diguanylate cyclase (GGDEF)-like protein
MDQPGSSHLDTSQPHDNISRPRKSRRMVSPEEVPMFQVISAKKEARLSQPFVLVSSSIVVLLVGVIDILTGPEISLGIFYLLPVAFVAWFTGRWNGILYAIAGVLIERIALTVAGTTYSHFLIPYWNTSVRLLFFLVVVYLLTEYKERAEREEILARTDPLTEVANSRYLYTLAEMEIERLSRYEHPFTVAYMDIDNFKEINDRYGRRTGDELLCLVASTMQNNLRITDTVARLGGDEFIILLPETKGEGALTIFFRLRQLLMAALHARGWNVTFSVGAITFLSPPMSVDSMIKAVDSLMYQVKTSGKDRIQHEIYE